MLITYDPSVDAAMVICRDGEYDVTLDGDVDGVTLNVDIDAEGNVLGLEILRASKFFTLVGERGGELSIPDRIDNPDTFDVETCFGVDE